MQIPKHTWIRILILCHVPTRVRCIPPHSASQRCRTNLSKRGTWASLFWSINHYHSGRAFITSKRGIVLGTNILFMLEFIIHSSASVICEKQDQKKKKSSKLPISLRVPFFPSNKRIKAICLLFVLFGSRRSVSLFHHFFQLCIFSTSSLN